MSLIHNISNSAARDADRKTALAYVGELGRQSGKGKNALPMLGIYCCEQAQNGTFEPEDNKLIYEDYITNESKKAEHQLGGKLANASKLKNFLKLGCMPTIDGVAVLQDAVLAHEQLRKAQIKVKSAYVAYETIAKAQLASPTSRLTPEEIRDLITTDPADKSAKDHIRAATKALAKAAELPQDLTTYEVEELNELLSKSNALLAIIEKREETTIKMQQLAQLQAELGLAA